MTINEMRKTISIIGKVKIVQYAENGSKINAYGFMNFEDEIEEYNLRDFKWLNDMLDTNITNMYVDDGFLQFIIIN